MSAAPEVPSLSRVRAALAEHGVRPRRSLGQHFLADRSLLRRMVDAAGLAPRDVVLEVGPGPGTLTAELLSRGARVVAVEVDPVMIGVLRALLGEAPDLTLIQEDILAGAPGGLPAGVERALLAALHQAGQQSYCLVANLPYQVAATLLARLFWTRPPERAVVTVQREVAERLAAAPGTRGYGPVGVLVQLQAEVRQAFRIPPGAFWPAPKIDSACVVLRGATQARVQRVEQGFLVQVVHAVFRARRKRLLNSLALAFGPRLDQVGLRAALEEKKWEKERRGEQLAPMEIVELAELLMQGGILRGPRDA